LKVFVHVLETKLEQRGKEQAVSVLMVLSSMGAYMD
jgi:hypothetical protein